MHKPEGARSLTRSWASRQRPLTRPIVGVEITTAQQLASSRHIPVEKIFTFSVPIISKLKVKVYFVAY